MHIIMREKILFPTSIGSAIWKKCGPFPNFLTGAYTSNPVCKEDMSPWVCHHRTLDSFTLQNIALIKIDIESTEDQFLEGARDTIASSRPILIIEIRGGQGWMNDPIVKKNIAHTIGLLKDMGYTLIKISIDDYLALPIEKFPL